MLRLLNKLFVSQYYAANAGFFLFFFFIFFGAVQGGSLLSYHLSLMNSMLSSAVTLSLVLFCWSLYHVKCIAFILKTVNSEEGKFLYNLQGLEERKQWFHYTIIHLFLYAPVGLYSVLLIVVGWKTGHMESAIAVLLFQLLSILISVSVIFYRLNNWITKINFPSYPLPIKKRFIFSSLHYFFTEKKAFLLLLKTLSLGLLYIILVWNKDRYDNDSFLLFYLVILMAHAIIPYLAVNFFEKGLSFYRNLPVSRFKMLWVYSIPYTIICLPELAYMLYHAHAFSLEQQLAYFINAVVSLFLLTAFLYSEATSREEYLKASFGLFFFSIFALHIQAFWVWIGIQLVAGMLLFVSGYYRYENVEE